MNLYVYPVLARRSRGISVGIDLNPDKACNFDCVYCRRLGEIVAAGGQIARVQLYTVARTPAVAEAGPLPNAELERIGAIIGRRVGLTVDIYP